MTIGDPLRDRRILLVEDEYLVAAELADVLRSVGAVVMGPYARVQPALDAVRRNPPDGALLDVRLDGETTERLAALLVERGIAVLLVTGNDPEALPATLRALPRLPKPFSSDDLLLALGRSFGEAPPEHA